MAHLAVDLLDIMAMLTVVERIGSSMFVDALWLYCFSGVMTTLGVGLLGFIAPATAGVVHGRSSDLFISAKVLALIGCFVIDLPFLIIRIFTALIMFSTFTDFDPFAYKNVISLVFRAIGLHHCRLVERTYSKEVQVAERQAMGFSVDSTASSSTSMSLQSPLVTTSLSMINYATAGASRVGHQAEFLLPFLHPPLMQDTKSSDTRRIKKSLHLLKSARRIPVVGFGLWAVMRRTVTCIFHPYSRRFGTFLDDEIELSLFQRLRLLVPLLATWVPLLVAGVLHLAAQLCHKPPMENNLYENGVWFGFNTPHDTITTVVAGGCALICFVCFLGLAPLYELLFVAIGSVVRVLSFEQSMVAFRLDSLNFSEQHSSYTPTYAAIAFVICCIYPLSAFWSSAKVIFCTLTGRKHLYYIRPPTPRRLLCCTASQQRQKIVNTASALVFFNCRHQIAPLSFFKLLAGPDMIKDLRVCYGMGASQWRDIFIIFLLKNWQVVAHLSLPMLIISFIHIIYLLIYVIVSHCVLLVALRKYEVRHMFVTLAAHRWRRYGSSLHSVGFSSPNQKPNYRTLFDVNKTFMSEGLFSSPGTIAPSLV
eukprot:GHVS01044916.1.p1 GENE.GHVS01044916.1~~GHVS01044916.1.p1  ORF type:complete len:663 (-),score=57.35 GHVS01044916.1:138-1913(-)